jgi:nucleoid DNA-binding protein
MKTSEIETLLQDLIKTNRPSQHGVKAIRKALFKTIASALAVGERVILDDIGTITPYTREARTVIAIGGSNKGKSILVGERSSLRIRPAASLKRLLNP